MILLPLDYQCSRFRDRHEFEKDGNLPRFMIMSLGEDHTTGTKPGTFTPEACVASNDLALGRLVEGVSHSKYWPRMAIFVIEDDAQNGPDHVDAHRTVGLVISPYTKRHFVDSTQYCTVSMIRTMELILGLPPLSQYDAGSRRMFASFTDRADLTPYQAVPAQIALDEPAQGWVRIELPGVFQVQRIVWGRDRNGVYQDRLPTQYKIEVATTPDHWQVVASSRDRIPWQSSPASSTAAAAGLDLELKRRDLLRQTMTESSPFMKIYAGNFIQTGPTYVLHRGDPMQKQEEVAPSGLAAVGPRLAIDPKAAESDRRLALVAWLTHPDNPLPARVMVNRVWQYHFGQGIVSTPSDFG